jgi:DNA-binding NarL/FixJ family response regulator
VRFGASENPHLERGAGFLCSGDIHPPGHIDWSSKGNLRTQQDMSPNPPRSILLVDDDPIILDTLSYGLRKASYAVRQCASARAALEEFARSPPDLAILNIGLPDMRGTALAERLLEHWYRPLLILSSHAEPEWIDRAICSGVIGYHVKPLTPAQLIPGIETALARFGHINRSIACSFGDVNMTEAQLRAAMDQFAFGAIIIDQDCQIVLCNRAGRKYLDGEGPFRNAHGKLKTASRNEPLSSLLDRCLGKKGDHPQPAAHSLHDPQSGAAIQILGIPLHSPGPGVGGSATVIINDSSRHTAVPSTLLKGLYGLTEKESRLAHALVNGMSIREHCERAFVTPNTARTHLKSIYRKTSTHRQAELISLLSRLYINLPVEGG